MKVTTFAKFGIGLTIAAVAACTLSAPAFADPVDPADRGILVGVGSDTTQDVVNGLAIAAGDSAGNSRIASYDAFGSPTLTTRTTGSLALPRANGSSAGLSALEASIGQAATAGIFTTANSLDQVDFARSSSGPANGSVANAVLTYIPFGKDAVDYAVSSDSYFPASGLTVGSSSDAFNSATGVGTLSLYSIYHRTVNALVTTEAGEYVKAVKTPTYVVSGDEVIHPIHAYLPQSGSGTRKYWEAQLGFTADDGTVNSNGLFDKKVTDVSGVPTADVPAVSVQEHDGTVINGDKAAIAPFSIGKWVAYKNNLAPDASHGVVLGKVSTLAATPVSPVTGSAGSYALNPDYVTENASIVRLVFNIVPRRLADNSRSLTNWAFVGRGSLVCSQKDLIKSYGFALLTATSGLNACGDTSRDQVQASPVTITVAAPTTAVKIGASYSLTATVVSVANGGGTIEFFDGLTSLGTKVLPAGAITDASETTAALTIDTANKLSLDPATITAQFTPTLLGVDDEAVSASAPVSFALATSKVSATAAAVKSGKAGTVKVSVTATGLVPTGTVTVKEGTKTLKSAVALVDGKISVVLPKLKKGTHKLVVSYSGSATVATAKSKTIAFKVK